MEKTKEEPTRNDILAKAKKDTGWTRGGGFRLEAEVIADIEKAIETEDKALSIGDFATVTGLKLYGKDVKSKCSNLANTFNGVCKKDYHDVKIKASVRKNDNDVALVKTDRIE